MHRLLRTIGLSPATLLALASLLAVAPRPAAAQAPWVEKLDAPLEKRLIAAELERRSQANQLNGHDEQRLRSGELLSRATCQSRGVVSSWLPGLNEAEWDVVKENVARLSISNLSDQPVWLIKATISPAPPSNDPLKRARARARRIVRPDAEPEQNSWTVLVPYMPPHSQMRIVTGCNTLSAADGESFDRLEVLGTPGPLTEAIARQLSRTPSAFYYESDWAATVTISQPQQQSLAERTLPWLTDRNAARVLTTAIRSAPPLDTAENNKADWLTAAKFADIINRAEPSTVNGIVDALAEAPIEWLQSLFTRIQEQHDGSERPELARLANIVCRRSPPEFASSLIVEEYKTVRSQTWAQRLLEACPVAPTQIEAVAGELAHFQRERPHARSWALSRLLLHLPKPTAHIVLSRVLGGDPEAIARELAALTAAGDNADSEAGYVPQIIDGGERSRGLWQALALANNLDKRTWIEAQVRPQDVTAAIGELLRWRMTAARLGSVDRLSAKLDALSPAEQLEAKRNLLMAALNTAKLEADLQQRMFRWAEQAPAELRPLALAGLAHHQSLFTPEALAKIKLPGPQLIDHFDGPLSACTAAKDPEACYQALSAHPEILAVARDGGLTQGFREQMALRLRRTDPDDAQLRALRHYVPLGLDPEPAIETACKRAKKLAEFDGEVDRHLAFIEEFAPEHPCLAELEQIMGAENQLLRRIGIAALALLVFVFGGAMLSRWRQKRLYDALDS